MKSIYINLDPYLAAFAAWLKAGKPGTTPTFNPPPLAVTVPLGQDVCIYIPVDSASDPGKPIVDGDDYDLSSVTVDGETFTVGDTGEGFAFSDIIQSAISLPFSAIATSGPKYAAARVTGASKTIPVTMYGGEVEITITFTVLVRRETASGPVDLVDFTPPVSLVGVSFAGVDIEGAEFDGNVIEAAADTGVLSAPAAGG